MTYPIQALKVNFTKLLRSPEFATQLSLLSDEKMNIDEDRTKISNWLMASLTDEDTLTASIDEFPVISKKIRDSFALQMIRVTVFFDDLLYTT